MPELTNAQSLTRHELAAWMPSDYELEAYRKSYVDFSESPMGFYPEKAYNYKRGRWETNYHPIKWVGKQRLWLQHCFTFDAQGQLPYDEIWQIDIGKSGKTMNGAGLAQWIGTTADLPGEVNLAANSREHSQIRSYGALRKSLLRSPHPYTESVGKKEIVWKNGCLGRAVPLKAETQAGADALFWGFDEVWAYVTESALQFFSEAKATPTQNISLRFIGTYPGYKQDQGPLNEMLTLVFDQDGEIKPGVSRPLGEDIPAYAYGTTFLWWNHAPYPWHLREVRGVSFLERERTKFRGREDEFKRIWQAEVVSSMTTFIHPKRWEDCFDYDHSPLAPREWGVPGVLAFDIGVKRDSTFAIYRGYDYATQRFPLLAHKCWYPTYDPEDPSAPPKVDLKAVMQWIIDMVRDQKVLAVYFDDTQAALIEQFVADVIKRENLRTELVPVSQSKGLGEASMLYYDLIAEGTLRNYAQCADLTQHVMDASRRYDRAGNFRIDKSQETGLFVDGAVADAMACAGVHERREDFVRLARRGENKRKVPLQNPYKDVYGLGVN